MFTFQVHVCGQLDIGSMFHEKCSYLQSNNAIQVVYVVSEN